MKIFFAFLVMLAITIVIYSQAPQKMSYQAVIRNASNTLIADKTVGMKISILKSSATGTAVYVETQTPKTNANGLVIIEIGGGTVVSGVFSAIDWSVGPYFLKTETDPAGEAGGSCCFYGSTGNGAFFNPGVFAQTTPHVHLDISNAYLDCPAPNASDGNWHHFVFIFSTQSGTSLNGVRVYYDGELLTGYTGNNFTTYPVNTGTTTKFTVGGKTGATSQMSIDDLRFYNRVLEGTEILQLYYESEFAGQAFVNDADGNTYNVIKIGDQVWMA